MAGAEDNIPPKKPDPRDALATKRRTMWRAMVPVPPHAPAPTFAHTHRAADTRRKVWEYRFEQQLYGYVVEFERSAGQVVDYPYTWCTDLSDARGLSCWHWKGWDEPKPLFVPATLLSGTPADVPVVVVQGEANAQAGHELLGHEFDFVTWPGGVSNARLAAWQWLFGRTVMLWPSCDAARETLSSEESAAGVEPGTKHLLPEARQPGTRAMRAIGALLVREHACTVSVCRVPAPGGVKAGWSVADALAEGWDAARVREFIRAAWSFDVPPADPAEPAAGISTPSMGSAKGGGSDPPAGSPRDYGGDDHEPEWWSRRQWERKKLADCRENVFLHLTEMPELKGLVAFDEFSHRVLKQRAPPWKSEAGEWTSNDDYLLGLWLAEHARLRIKSETTIIQGVGMAAWAASYHPVRDYFAQLPAWDGVGRLEHWLHECLGAKDDTYTRLVGAWFVMGICARIINPGCQMDYMVVLEGLQGKQKSTALRVLAIRDEWFADTPIKIGDKDALLSLAGKLLYEIGELDSFNRAEVTAVKQYVSSRVDRVREPFQRRPADRPRSGVLCGSTNQSEYFKDQTGNRRFWPVACDDNVDLDKLRQWLAQLYAEALVRLKSDDPDVRRYWPTREEENEHLVKEQESREIVDPWFERVSWWVDCHHKYADTVMEVHERDSFSTEELLIHAVKVPIDRIDGGRQMATRIGIVMHRLRWTKKRESDGRRLYRYHRPPAPPPGDKQAVAPAGLPPQDPTPVGAADASTDTTEASHAAALTEF